MPTQRQVVSVSLSSKTLYLLDKICQKEDKSRSQMVKDLIRQYALERRWENIFKRGKKTARQFHIRSEADILRLISD